MQEQCPYHMGPLWRRESWGTLSPQTVSRWSWALLIRLGDAAPTAPSLGTLSGGGCVMGSRATPGMQDGQLLPQGCMMGSRAAPGMLDWKQSCPSDVG